MMRSGIEQKAPAVARVYDIHNCGPNNRFVANGKLVHNSGGDGNNPQNMGRGSPLRDSLEAPEGHTVVACDSSQIEARVTAYVAGQDDLTEAFRNNADIYSDFASDVFGRPVNRKRKEVGPDGKEFYPDVLEGFVGKTCLAEGTLVLCDSGWKPIEQVSINDLVWDGKDWVCHKGVVSNGWKETLPLCGLWLTPDHLVLSGTRWLEAQFLERDENALCQALATGAESLSSLAISSAHAEAPQRSLSGATADFRSTPSTTKTIRTSSRRAATSAQRKPLWKSVTGYIAKLCRMTHIGLGSSTALLLRLLGATLPQASSTSTTAVAGSAFSPGGVKTEQNSCAMSRHSPAGMSRHSKWTASTPMETTNLETSVSYPGAITCGTRGASQTSRRKLRVYDISSAGPRHRFTVQVDGGALVVHNCILGLGFGMGPPKFQGTLKKGQGSFSYDMALPQCEDVVSLYRTRFAMIPKLWRASGECLKDMESGGCGTIGVGIQLRYDQEGIYLPNGMMLRYPELAWREFPSKNGGTERQLSYIVKRGRSSKVVRIHGPKGVENIVQALARIVVFEQMLQIKRAAERLAKKYGGIWRVVLTVHDEVVAIVPTQFAAQFQALMVKAMSVAPAWAPELPVACEAGRGPSYGDCK